MDSVPPGHDAGQAAALLMRFLAAYAALALSLAGCMLLLGLLIASPAPVLSPLDKHGPCVAAILGPTTRFYCANARGYDRYPDGHWQDAGPITPSGPGLGYAG